MFGTQATLTFDGSQHPPVSKDIDIFASFDGVRSTQDQLSLRGVLMMFEIFHLVCQVVVSLNLIFIPNKNYPALPALTSESERTP